jgi:hypothetical protein
MNTLSINLMDMMNSQIELFANSINIPATQLNHELKFGIFVAMLDRAELN